MNYVIYSYNRCLGQYKYKFMYNYARFIYNIMEHKLQTILNIYSN